MSSKYVCIPIIDPQAYLQNKNGKQKYAKLVYEIREKLKQLSVLSILIRLDLTPK